MLFRQITAGLVIVVVEVDAGFRALPIGGVVVIDDTISRHLNFRWTRRGYLSQLSVQSRAIYVAVELHLKSTWIAFQGYDRRQY